MNGVIAVLLALTLGAVVIVLMTGVLGMAKGGDFNRVFVDAFERIILGGQDIRRVLDDQKSTLAGIMEETGAPCWAPDAPSEGACPVD